MKINTDQYVRTHGRRPKGFGRWLFAPAGQAGERTQWIEVNGTFTAAKQTASKIARQAGVRELEVLP